MNATLAAALILVAGQNNALHILDAVYGNADRGRFCDVLLPVSQQCDDRTTCLVSVSNGMCGDPDFGHPKQLYLAFKCGGFPAKVLQAPEGSVVRLACGVP